jgi:hypothetical protein
MTATEFSSTLQEIINGFDSDQKRDFGRYEDVQTRIADIKGNYDTVKKKFNNWSDSNQVFLILAVIVPIIVTVLQATQNLAIAASLLSAVFPVCVGIVKTKIDTYRTQRDGFLDLREKYQQLLYDAVEAIANKTYNADSEKDLKASQQALNEKYVKICGGE